MKKKFRNFLECFFSDYGCCQNFEDILKYFMAPYNKSEKKELISMLKDLIQENNWEVWPDYFKEAGLKMSYNEAEQFIQKLYKALTDDTVPKDMFQHFLAYYFTPSSDTQSLETIVNNFKEIESAADQQLLINDLNAIITANNYPEACKKINEHCSEPMNPEEAKNFIISLAKHLQQQ